MRRLIVKTRMTGHFQGFETKQLFHLQNGETWQQDAVKRRYAYRYRPKATVWRESDSFYMEIEGMHELIQVHRVGEIPNTKYQSPRNWHGRSHHAVAL